MLWSGCFIQANSSLKLFGGSVGRPASVFEVMLTRPMGTKSFSASKVRSGYSVMPAASAGWCSMIV
jgi:hypothetical protein